jgi:RNA polymerase sigma factor (sigma-70 family)
MNVSAIGHLQTLFDAGTALGTPDGLLLERFIAQRDAMAFEAIVARHGPMVIGVCRRMLPELSDVEDAFQATFLILVRKAQTLRDRQRLGPWLYGVAHRVASRARAQAARRRSRERACAGNPAAILCGDLEQRELLAVLDDEIARLPERFRAAVVLCDREGRTYEEAARQLGCPLGTLKSRLSGARTRLRGRLARRGLAPAAALAAGISGRTASAEVPRALAGLTSRAALNALAGRTASSGTVSASAFTLAEGVLRTMFLLRLRTMGALLMALGFCAAGLGVLAQQPSESPEDQQIKRLESLLQSLKQRRDMMARFKQDQDRAAAQLEALGGRIERGVVSVNLVATKVTDHDLSSLSIFPNLQTIHLHHTAISDAGVANLERLRNLTTLDLFDTRVTDAGLQHLSEWMPHLET